MIFTCAICGKTWTSGNPVSTCPYCDERDLIKDHWVQEDEDRMMRECRDPNRF